MDHPTPSPDVEITVCRPECCIGHTGGMAIGVWASSVRPHLLPDAERAVRAAFACSPRGVTTLSIYRIGRHFPLSIEDSVDFESIWRTLRSLQSCLRGSASVVEPGGVLTLLLRNAVHSLEMLTGPAYRLPVFDRVNEALLWLLPRTVDPLPLAHYLRAVAAVERAHRDLLGDDSSDD